MRIFCVSILLALSSFDLVKLLTTPCTVEATGQSGECMFMSDCPMVLADYQKFKKMPTLCDRKYRTVCCPMKVATTTTTTTTTTAAPKRVSERKCKEYGKYIYETIVVQNPILGEPPITKRVDICAHKVVELIVGGETAREREFPHMALIGFKQGRPADYQCGGSLISELFVLSAAHCSSTAEGPAKFAKVGNVIRNRDNPNTWTYSIAQRFPHPNYSSQHAEDDIVLFKLNDTVKLNRYVIPLCLPQTGALTTRKAIASGWGRTDFAEDVSETLMKVTIDYFDEKKCDEIYEDEEKLEGKGITWSKMVCAGSTNKTGDTCNGDSGGPLQIYNSDTECMYTIVGVTSFGSVYCGAIGVPAIYTKVFYYLDWIESVVWPGE